MALPCQPKTAVTNATTYGKLLFCLFQREHTARKSSKPTAYGKVLKRKKLTLVRKPHVPVILISFGRSEKLCSKFCLRLASMANIINAYKCNLQRNAYSLWHAPLPSAWNKSLWTLAKPFSASLQPCHWNEAMLDLCQHVSTS